MIIRGGENVYPVEIESTLSEHPAVFEAAVIGVDDEHWGEIVVAAITLREGTSTDEEELRAHCRSRLATYKVPQHVVFFDSLPKNATNKLVKSEIKTMVLARFGDRRR
jgi:acyl-CoA synthetase (AMP-forming)/AMP-acid ligase II